MAAQIRRFVFFDKDVVKDPETREPFTGFQSLPLTCSTSGRGALIFGDSDGFVHEVDRTLQLTSFQAFEYGVTHLLQMKQSNLLIAAGNDEEGINPALKVFNLDKVDRGGAPQLVRTIKVPPGRQGKLVPVSCIAAHESMTQLAIGMYDGTVLLSRGDLSRDKFSNKPPRVIHDQGSPVTALHFTQQGRETALYVTTVNAVVSYVTTQGDRKETLDTVGCELNCACISEKDGMLWVGRTDQGLQSYVPEGRGGAVVFDGKKERLMWFRNYLVVISRSVQTDGTFNKMNTLTFYDTRNRFIAFVAGFPDITHILGEWGSFFVLTGDGKMYQLVEKDFQTKLEMLFKKSMYDIAINLAKSQAGQGGQVGEDNLTFIYSQYANHLYGKGSYDAAIQQYIKTIGKLEPSHVIRKFLDSQRIFNLTDYLQALHEKELADKHHTTLLLNCYTKLKNVAKLDEFIMTDKNLNFDLETAITVCRQAGYFRHAVYLARKFEQHDWYLKVQLEDEKNYPDALRYIAALSFEEAEKNLKSHGKELVNQLPEETTDLLIRLCTGYEPTREEDASGGAEENADAAGGEKPSAGPEEFIHIYVNQIPSLKRFLEHMVRTRANCPSQVYDTLLELYLREYGTSAGDARDVQMRDKWIMNLLQSPDAQYDEYHALVLAQVYDFRPGILYLYEKAKQYQQIVQYYMEKNSYADVIESCKKYGTADRSLWVQTLSYFAGKEEDCRDQIKEVLAHIDRRNLLPPLMVVEALARNSTATLAVVKDYITRRLSHENQNIAEDERLIRQYREDTKRMQGEIETLKSEAKVFQDMKCTNCGGTLDLPAVHFLCGHSYHERCLQNEFECTACSEDRRKVMDIVQSQSQLAEQHEKFFKELDGTENRFGVVADYFGRGLFNKVVLQTDVPSPVRPAAARGSKGGFSLGVDPEAALGGGPPPSRFGGDDFGGFSLS